MTANKDSWFDVFTDMTNHYIHGYSAEEQSRLTAMQRLLNERQLNAMDFSGVRRLLDVGSGLGQLTRGMARRLAAGGRVIGIEYSEAQLAEARRQAALENELDLVEFRHGSAFNLPLEEEERSSFDLVHARFLLEHVTEPQRVVDEMMRATRVGGQIVLVDDDHDVLRIWPTCEPLERAWEIYWRSYYEIGVDPLVGRKLGELLTAAGAEDIRLDSIFYGAHAGGELFDPVVDNLKGVISSAADLMADRGLLSPAEMQQAMEAVEQWRQSPVACVWYSLPMAVGIRTE